MGFVSTHIVYAWFERPRSWNDLLPALVTAFEAWQQGREPDGLAGDGGDAQTWQVRWDAIDADVVPALALHWDLSPDERRRDLSFEYGLSRFYQPADYEGMALDAFRRRERLALSRFLIALLTAGGAELAYLTATDTRFKAAEAEALYPECQAERLRALLSRRDALDVMLAQGELGYFWMLALPQERFGWDFERLRQRIASEAGLRLRELRPEYVLLENRDWNPLDAVSQLTSAEEVALDETGT